MMNFCLEISQVEAFKPFDMPNISCWQYYLLSVTVSTSVTEMRFLNEYISGMYIAASIDMYHQSCGAITDFKPVNTQISIISCPQAIVIMFAFNGLMEIGFCICAFHQLRSIKTLKFDLNACFYQILCVGHHILNCLATNEYR